MKASAYISIHSGQDLDFGSVVCSRDFLLTTEHAASSYGLPVAIDRRTGQVFGPAEIHGDLIIVGSDLCDGISKSDIQESAKRAGYSVA